MGFENTSAKLLIIALLSGLMLSLGSAPDPRHPLSQVYPIDVDLNMENQDIENVSKLQLNDGIGQKGLMLEGYAITHEGEAQKFILDYQNGEWDIENSNLNMNGNNITDIDTLHFVSGGSISESLNTSGGDVNLDNGSINDVDSIDGGGDPVRFDDDIDLNSNNLVEPNEIQTGGQNIQVRDTTNGQDITRFQEGGNVVIPNGDLNVRDSSSPALSVDMHDAGSIARFTANQIPVGIEIQNSNNKHAFIGVDGGAYLGSGNNDEQVLVTAGGDVEIQDDSNKDIAVFRTSTRNVEIPNGNLNMNSNNITNFFENNCETREVVAGVDDDGGYYCVDIANEIMDVFVNESGDKMTGRLDMQGNHISNVNYLDMNSVGDIRTDGTDAIRLDSNQNVGIPNGNLEMSSNSITGNGKSINFGGSLFQISGNNDVGISTGGGGSNSVKFLDSANSNQVILEGLEGGNVKIPNGKLEVSNGHRVEVESATDSSRGVWIHHDDTDGEVRTNYGGLEFITGNSEAPLFVENGGPVNVQNSDLNVDNQLSVGSTQCNVGSYIDGDGSCTDVVSETSDEYVNEAGDTMTGDLNMNYNKIDNVGELNVSTSTDQIAHFSDTGVTLSQPLSVESSGPLSVSNGVDLTGSSSNTIESYSTMYLQTSSGSPSDIVLDPTGDVGIDANASITGDLSVDSELSVGATQCSTGSYIDGDGSCTDVISETSGEYVNEAGDTMTGTLDMNSNPIVNVGSNNIDIGDGQGNIAMNGQRIIDGGLVQVSGIGVTDSLSTAETEVSGNSVYVQGDVSVDGDFVGAGADVAENINNESEMSSGTVVQISGNMSVDKTDERRDTAVAGVVSRDPAMVMAKERDGVPIAMSGTVPVKFSDENGGVKPGDMLTTASKEGHAMKCSDIVKCQGSIIGKAMQPQSETGEVKMLISRG